MPNEKYSYRKEYNYKDILKTYHKLEELTVRLFLLWHFERSEYQSVSTRDPYDFIINKGERLFLVILKYFRNLQVIQNNLRFVYKNLQELEFNDKAVYSRGVATRGNSNGKYTKQNVAIMISLLDSIIKNIAQSPVQNVKRDCHTPFTEVFNALKDAGQACNSVRDKDKLND